MTLKHIRVLINVISYLFIHMSFINKRYFKGHLYLIFTWLLYIMLDFN